MTYPKSVKSLSASILADSVNPANAGVFVVVTVAGDEFLLDYNVHRIVKNNRVVGSARNLEDELDRGRISRGQLSKRLVDVHEWEFGFKFATVCEVGKSAYFILGSGQGGFSNSLLTDEVVDIQRIA